MFRVDYTTYLNFNYIKYPTSHVEYLFVIINLAILNGKIGYAIF
jgi:hypothetical protein